MNDMTRLTLIAFLTVSLATAGTAAAQSAAENAQVDRYVAVNGEASISVTPDTATLNMAVQARNASLDAARDEVVKTTRDFLDFADERDIDDEDVQTSGLNVRPDYRWNDKENRQELQGYFVQRDVVVKLKDMQKLGRIMEGAIEVGINQVQPPVLSHSNEKSLRRRALATATRDARTNAEQIAKSLNAKLGPVRNVTAMDGGRPQPRFNMMSAREADTSGADTYSTGQIRIEARVNAQFDLIAN